MTDDADRLAAALDRAERQAEAAGDKPWMIDHHECGFVFCGPPGTPCDEAARCAAGICHCAVINGDDIRIYDEGGHDASQAAHIVAWQPAQVMRLIARDRALLAAHASAERNVAEHVSRCGPDPCGHRDYLAATTALQILTTAVGAAAKFWMPDPEETR